METNDASAPADAHLLEALKALANPTRLQIMAWLRSPEEETGDVRVYRPEDHPFPPARGREGLTFHSDGRFDYRAPGRGGDLGEDED